MKISALIRAMAEAGASIDLIVATVEKIEAPASPPSAPLPNARQALLPRDWQARRVRVFERDNYECRYCGKVCVDPHCDHIHPLSRGGSSDEGNLVTACPTCNLRKKDRTPEEWGVALIGGRA
ncbi:HNH endonuclease [Brevundimonas sp.]|uniref:HNH endonuclease n=1 Tax=Brevundimonas sp. TaxID=1871086 RepID=UPI0039183917